MPLTLEDVLNQSHYITDTKTGLSIFLQTTEGSNQVILDYDDGTYYKSLPLSTPVEPTASGTILIDGSEYRAYVAHQVTFTQSQD